MNFISTLLAFIGAIAILVTFHEYGHFWAARRCGVKVLRFSVGFGKPLWLRCFGPDRTELTICAIPLGGYVKMLDEREGPVADSERARAFNRQSVGRRAFIVAAGPIANFLLAILIFAFLYVWGIPGMRPVVAAPPPGSVAAQAGLQARDTILRVNGHTVQSWVGVEDAVEGAIDGIRFTVRDPSGKIREISLPQAPVTGLGDLGVELWLPTEGTLIGFVAPGSPAAKADIRPGDRIVAINGVPVCQWPAVVDTVRSHPDQSLRLSLDRKGQPIERTVVPDRINTRTASFGRIGAAPKIDAAMAKSLSVVVRTDPWHAVGQATMKVYDVTFLSLRAMVQLVTGQAPADTLSGPITIADFAGKTARQGLVPYLSFLALISVSLGFMNLLPVPLLDGGHLMYYMAEVIKGRPVSERAVMLGQRIGIVLLFTLMACALYNDLTRLLTGF